MPEVGVCVQSFLSPKFMFFTAIVSFLRAQLAQIEFSYPDFTVHKF